MVCEENAATGATQEAWEKQQAWHAFERQVATLGEADALKWAWQPGMGLRRGGDDPPLRSREGRRPDDGLEAAAGKLTRGWQTRRARRRSRSLSWRDQPMRRRGFVPPT